MVDPYDLALLWRSVDRYLLRHGLSPGDPVPYAPEPDHPDGWWPTTGGVHASNSMHPLGRARDYSARRGVNVPAVAALLLPLAIGNTEGGKIWLHQFFWTPGDFFIQDGHRVPENVVVSQGLRPLHTSHLHVATFEHDSLDGAI